MGTEWPTESEVEHRKYLLSRAWCGSCRNRSINSYQENHCPHYRVAPVIDNDGCFWYIRDPSIGIRTSDGKDY